MAALRRGVIQVWTSRRAWNGVLHLALTVMLGPLWFIVLAYAVFSLVMPPIGVPAAASAVALARQGAIMERGRARVLLGVELIEPYRPLPHGRLFARLRAAAADPATWRDLLALALLLPAAVIAAAGLTLPAVAVAAPVWLWETGLWASVLAAVIGVLTLPLMPFVWIGLAAAHGVLVRALLGPTRTALDMRVAQLSASRARAVDAAEAERRRIERDLHDGAQQRLVALAMHLGMAKERFADDPEAARTLVVEAHEEAKRALVELRDLARGIHPAVLTDRGLDAALSALAGRSPIPVEVDVRLDGRLPPPLEASAYFVVAEALTNVARHSGARHATVSVAREGHQIVAEVRDDGIGGARSGPGSGLGGLADRVAAIEGRLLVDSPPGGPTSVRAELPCAS